MGFHVIATLDPAPESRGHKTSMAGFPITTSGHRYYSPSLGRWLSRDPIGERGGIAIYVANANSAISTVDVGSEVSAKVT